MRDGGYRVTAARSTRASPTSTRSQRRTTSVRLTNARSSPLPQSTTSRPSSLERTTSISGDGVDPVPAEASRHLIETVTPVQAVIASPADDQVGTRAAVQAIHAPRADQAVGSDPARKRRSGTKPTQIVITRPPPRSPQSRRRRRRPQPRLERPTRT